MIHCNPLTKKFADANTYKNMTLTSSSPGSVSSIILSIKDKDKHKYKLELYLNFYKISKIQTNVVKKNS